MAGYAPFFTAMNALGIQNFPRMAPKAVIIYRFDAGMRFMAFVTVEARHRHLGRERCPRRGPMAVQTPLPVGNEHAGLLWGKRMAHCTGCVLHAHPMDLPVLVASQAGGLFWMERMH